MIYALKDGVPWTHIANGTNFVIILRQITNGLELACLKFNKHIVCQESNVGKLVAKEMKFVLPMAMECKCE